VSGNHLTDQQIRLYMNERKEGHTQTTSAAKAGISERSARRIDTGQIFIGTRSARHWRTRKDPLKEVWEQEIVPLLEENAELLPATLFELLCDNYPGTYDGTILRTLQRRIKSWKAKHGPAKDVMFRQVKVPGQQGLSDFTLFKNATITLKGEVFKHLLYHYRLAFSGWCYVKVNCGGESYTALSTGLQNAFWRSGGVPKEHRTDSLSAAYKNKAEKEQLTIRYEDLCRHYGVKATRNTPGLSHENGAIESPHGHLKRRMYQALLLRGSTDFDSLEDYQLFVDGIVSKINRRCQTRFKEERAALQALPRHRTHDYAEHRVLVSSSSSFLLKRVTYTVPSRLIGERLYIQLHDERLELFLGHEKILVLPRVYASKNHRARCVNYKHVIDALVRKPQAFRYSQIRDDLLPSPDYKLIWQHVDKALPAHEACRYIVRLLHLAATQRCEAALGRYVLRQIEKGKLPDALQCAKRFGNGIKIVPLVTSNQHDLADYDQLLAASQEVHHV